MKRILILSMMLFVGFSGLSSSVSLAKDDEAEAVRPAGSIATGDDPNDLNSKTFTKSGTQAGTSAIGVANSCPECAAHSRGIRLGEDTNYRKGSSGSDSKESGAGGTR